MHPILFKLPLPDFAFPLGPALLLLCALSMALAVVGFRRREADLLLVGVALGVGGAIGAFRFWGARYQLPEVPVPSYGVLLGLSLVVGYRLTLGLGEKRGHSRDLLANTYLVTAFAAFLGARCLYVLTNLDEFSSVADVLAVRRGGMVAYGGFLGGAVGAWLYLRRRGLPWLAWADLAAPSLAAGLALTRIGCYLFGCDFGKPLSDTAPGWLKALGSFPKWTANEFPNASGSPAWAQHVIERGLSPEALTSLPVHPTQLYESLFGVALLGLVLWLLPRQKFQGQSFLCLAFLYSVGRFLLEVLRDDAERGHFGPTLAMHWALGLAGLVFVAAFVIGPSRSIDPARLRLGLQGAALIAGAGVIILLRWLGDGAAVQLSTSQWIGVVVAVLVALAWSAQHEQKLSASTASSAAHEVDEGST